VESASVIHLHRRKHVQAKVASVKPQPNMPQANATAAIPFSFDSGDQSPPQPPAQTARVETPPATAHPALQATPITGQPVVVGQAANDHLSKRGAVLFERDAPAPSPAQYHGLQVLAGDLNSALEAGASRVQLQAYGGVPGDKSSDARRLSLRRALAVRQLLIDDGIPSSRIDVRAMGGIDDKGPSDRVDVFIRAG
jgi:outer membrane protein OmpA-like peptidoglycan-associated protein